MAASLNTHYAEPIDVEVLDSNEGVEEEPQVSVSDIPEVENEVRYSYIIAILTTVTVLVVYTETIKIYSLYFVPDLHLYVVTG